MPKQSMTDTATVMDFFFITELFMQVFGSRHDFKFVGYKRDFGLC